MSWSCQQRPGSSQTQAPSFHDSPRRSLEFCRSGQTFHVCWQLCRGLVDYGPGQSQLFRPSLSGMTAHFFVSSLWCSPELQWLLWCSSIKTWHNVARAPSFIIFLVCIVCFLIVGSQTETEWNLWWPWHHFGFGFGQVIHRPSVFACEYRGDVHQARHASDVCVDMRVGLLSPALFHPLLQMHFEELTRYLSGNFIVEGADSRRTKTI